MLNRRTAVTNPLGQTSTTTYDAVGNVLAVTDPLQHTTTFQYDPLSRLVSATDPLGGVTAFTYDAVGNRTSLTDPLNNTTTWTYDALNQVTSETNQMGHARLFVYDAAGNLIERTDRNGRAIAYEHDALNRTTAERWLDGGGATLRTLEFTYDAASQLLTAADPAGTFLFQYDVLGRITSETQTIAGLGFDVHLAQQFDAVGNRTQLTATLGGTADFVNDYAYDALDRMTQITRQGVPGGSAVAPIRIDLTYDAAGQFDAIRRYNDLAATQLVVESRSTFDAAGRLTALAHEQGATTLAAYSWTYDAANRVTEFDSLLDGTATYAYDDTNQVIGASYSYQTDELHAYDANGNRTGGGHITGDNNQTLSDGEFDYEYDAEGNRTRRTHIASGEVTEYDWDHRNRLVKVTERASLNGPATKIVEYSYDAFNRRTAKSIDLDGDGNADEQVFLINDGLRASRGNAGDHIVLSLDGAGEVTNRYLHGPAVDQILADEQIDPSTEASEVIWPLADNLGTVRDLALHDESLGITEIANHRQYDAFGNISSETDSAVEHIFTFTGRELDTETDLLYYRGRYYDPVIGQFLSQDPIGFAAGDANLRRYVGNRVTTDTDPSGLINWGAEWAFVVQQWNNLVAVAERKADSTDSIFTTLFEGLAPGNGSREGTNLVVNVAAPFAAGAIDPRQWPDAVNRRVDGFFDSRYGDDDVAATFISDNAQLAEDLRAAVQPRNAADAQAAQESFRQRGADFTVETAEFVAVIALTEGLGAGVHRGSSICPPRPMTQRPPGSNPAAGRPAPPRLYSTRADAPATIGASPRSPAAPTPLELVQGAIHQQPLPSQINFSHILHGEVRPITHHGVVVGQRGVGGHYVRSPNVRVTQILEQADRNGVVVARIEIRDPATGGWVPKRGNSSLYPSHWSARQVQLEIESAFRNSVPVTTDLWEGISPSGVRIHGYYTKPDGGASTAWPVHGN